MGVVRDPRLGPMVVVAAGGVLVELLADRAVALPPLSADAARRLLDRLRVRPLLDGWRGGAPADLDALADLVAAVSRLALELGDDLEALDLNPVIAGPDGAIAVDALVLPRRPTTTTTTTTTTRRTHARAERGRPPDPGPGPGLHRHADPARGGGRARRRCRSTRPSRASTTRTRCAAGSTRPTCRPRWAGRASPPCSRCWCRSRWAGSPTASPGSCTPLPSGGRRSPPRSSSSAGCDRRWPGTGTSATPSPRSSPAVTSAP